MISCNQNEIENKKENCVKKNGGLSPEKPPNILYKVNNTSSKANPLQNMSKQRQLMDEMVTPNKILKKVLPNDYLRQNLNLANFKHIKLDADILKFIPKGSSVYIPF